jgi:hypothetical protein
MKLDRKHVFNDLQPYVCILENCTTPNRVFNQRRDWEDHLRQESGAPFGQECPLCLVVLPSSQKWRSHVGREMQQLALFAVPKEMYGRDDDVEESSNESIQSEAESDGLRPRLGTFIICAECPLRLIPESILVHHIRTDHGVEPIFCEKCNYPFSREGDKISHLQREHPDRESDQISPTTTKTATELTKTTAPMDPPETMTGDQIQELGKLSVRFLSA